MKKKNKKAKDPAKKAVKLFPLIEQNIVPCLPIHSIKADGMEADDCIAATVRILENLDEPRQVIIVSTDQDFYQLVDNHTLIYNPTTKKLLSQQGLQEKFGIANVQNLAWVKATCGDTSDNIAGLFRFGLKTLQKCMKEHLDAEDRWSFEQVEAALHEHKFYDAAEIKLAHKIIQLVEPLNLKGEIQARKKIEFALDKGYKFNEKEMFRLYQVTPIMKDIGLERLKQKTLVFYEFLHRHKKAN